MNEFDKMKADKDRIVAKQNEALTGKVYSLVSEEWTFEDWKDLNDTIERLKKRIAKRHSTPANVNVEPRNTTKKETK